MSLRARIAFLVGVTVLIASAVGGFGTALSSRNVGRDRIDQELTADAARIPTDATRIANQLQFLIEARRVTCDESVALSADQPDSAGPDTPEANANDGSSDGSSNAGGGRLGPNGRRLRSLPAFASSLQVLRPNGTSIPGCLPLPVNAEDKAMATSGQGTSFRTASIDGERFRILTIGYGDVGAVQFARSLEITDDTLRGLMVRIIGFGIAGAAVAATLGWWFAKRATDPVKQLSETANRVARTRDLGERINIDTDDEIGALADSFNTMLTSLDTSREQQQRLVQDASHELRTPLTSMRTNVELLQRHQNIDGDVRQQVLADITSELAELTDLTAELVESATEVPTNLAVSTMVDLSEIATDCVERARRRHHRDIALRISDNPQTMVAGDVSLLGRAITNLINNAVKFSESESPLEVVVTGSALSVLDRGPGVDEDDLAKIFDRFYRSTTARSAPGSGLGLAIVKQIVEGHNGWVSAANRDGGGAAIGFSLPPSVTTEVD